MVADESFGVRFFYDYEASNAQVSYFKWLGGPQDGKHIIKVWVIDLDLPSKGNHIKEEYCINTQ